MSLKDLIIKLSEASGCPGFEQDIGRIIREELQGHVDSLVSDRMNNVIASKGAGKTIMIAAHMDEIGLMVRHIDDKGYIRFAKLGGISDQLLLGQRVTIYSGKGPVAGVIGCKPVHLMKDDERKKLLPYENMFIDIGAGKREDVAAAGVKIGDAIVINRAVTELGGGLLCGKAFDDRSGCAILTEVLKQARPKNRLVGVFTIQEEVGLRGATMSAFAVNPDIGIAIDTSAAADHPEVQEYEGPIKLKSGPAICVADGRRDSLGGGILPHPRVLEWLVRLAQDLNIPHQLEVFEGGTTDGSAIQLSRSGVPSGVVSLPSRYIHTFSEVIALEDAENVVKLLVAAVQSELPV